MVRGWGDSEKKLQDEERAETRTVRVEKKRIRAELRRTRRAEDEGS